MVQTHAVLCVKEEATMDFDKYKNPLTYPTKPNKPRIDISASAEEARQYADELEQYEKARVVFEAERRTYNEKTAELEEQFWKDAFDELGIAQDHPKAAPLRRIAWDHGHADGLHSVYWQLEELSVLL
jgi:hypothetical protein